MNIAASLESYVRAATAAHGGAAVTVAGRPGRYAAAVVRLHDTNPATRTILRRTATTPGAAVAALAAAARGLD